MTTPPQRKPAGCFDESLAKHFVWNSPLVPDAVLQHLALDEECGCAAMLYQKLDVLMMAVEDGALSIDLDEHLLALGERFSRRFMCPTDNEDDFKNIINRDEKFVRHVRHCPYCNDETSMVLESLSDEAVGSDGMTREELLAFYRANFQSKLRVERDDGASWIVFVSNN